MGLHHTALLTWVPTTVLNHPSPDVSMHGWWGSACCNAQMLRLWESEQRWFYPLLLADDDMHHGSGNLHADCSTPTLMMQLQLAWAQ
jgi:hypothetical protein